MQPKSEDKFKFFPAALLIRMPMLFKSGKPPLNDKNGRQARFRRRSISLWILGLVLVALLVSIYWPFINGSLVFYRSDSSCFYQPFCNYITAALSSGRIPLWNPMNYCGMPQIAIPVPGMFYPPHLVFMLLPFSQALAVLQILHQLIGGVGAYLVARAIGCTKAPSWICGLSFAMCGYNFSASQNFSLVTTAAWLPLCLAFALQAGRAKSHPTAKPATRPSVGLAISYAMMLLAGRPEIWLIGSLVLVLCIAHQFIFRRPNQKRDGRALLRTVCALTFGSLIAMPALLPTWEWTMLSSRATGLDASSVLEWSASWFDWLGMILCEPLGDMSANGNQFLSLIAGREGYIQFIPSIFLGPAVLTLATWGLVRTRLTNAWFLPILLLLGIALASGVNIPGASFCVEQLPILRVLRYPVKATIFVELAVVLLAARGMTSALKAPNCKEEQLASGILWFGAAAVLLQFWQTPQNFLHPANTSTAAVVHTAAELISGQAVLAILAGAAMCAARAIFSSNRLSRQSFIAFTAVLVAMPLIYSGMMLRRAGGSPDFYRIQSGLPQILDKFELRKPLTQRVFTADINEWGPSQEFHKRYKTSLTEEALQFDRQICHPNTNIDADVEETYGYEAASTGMFQDLVFSTIKADVQDRSRRSELADLVLYRLCRLTASGSLMTRSFTADDFGNRLSDFPVLNSRYFTMATDDRALNFKLYKVNSPLDRVYFPRRWRTGDSAQTVKSLFLDTSDTRIDPQECSYLAREAGSSREPVPAVGQTDGLTVSADLLDSEPSVSLVSNEPEHLVLNTDTRSERLLVLADTFYPGWYAYIDNKQTKILRTNLVNRGLMVPPGKHTIEFIYSPISLKLGIALAFLGISGVLALAVSKFWQD